MAQVKDYSVEEKLVGLLSLQKIDSKGDELQRLKGELPMEVKDMEDELEGMNVRLANIDNDIATINGYIDQKTAAKKEASQLIKKYEKQLDAVKNNREHEALTKEIDNQDLEVQLNDKHIRDANTELLERKGQRAKTEERMATINENLAEKREELNKIIRDTEKEEKKLTQESDETRKRVDARLLSAYERIRRSYANGLAVVPILRDSCGGCYNIIPPQRQSEIRQRKKIIVCEHCGRVIVDAELHTQVAGEKV